MDTLQVPTRAIEVELWVGSGELLGGRMFASELPGEHSDASLLLELLNDDREFIPFLADSPENGRISLNKHHIIRATLGPDHEIEAVAPGDGDGACSLLLSDGERLTGRLRVATPWSASRVLDKLNQATRFVPVVTTAGVTIVHGAHIVRVE